MVYMGTLYIFSVATISSSLLLGVESDQNLGRKMVETTIGVTLKYFQMVVARQFCYFLWNGFGMDSLMYHTFIICRFLVFSGNFYEA